MPAVLRNLSAQHQPHNMQHFGKGYKTGLAAKKWFNGVPLMAESGCARKASIEICSEERMNEGASYR